MYILEKADVTFFEKYIQRGNAQILSAIVNDLGNAVSDFEKDGKTWVDRALESTIAEQYQDADSAERAQFDTWYQDPAVRLAEEAIFRGEYLAGEYVFDPDTPVTREEFLAMCMKVAGTAPAHVFVPTTVATAALVAPTFAS